MSTKIDLLVIGAGPGGYPAAIRAAQLGKRVILVEKGWIGGECLNWGCIPSKALIHASSLYHEMLHGTEVMGISVKDVSVDMKKLQNWKQGVQDTLIGGIKTLLKSHKVRTIMGTAQFIGSKKVVIYGEDKAEEIIEAEKIIIATGSSFISLPGFEIDEESILSAKGLLSLQEIPKHLVCIGGGIIGLELGTVYAKLGAKVTVIELMKNLLPSVNPKLAAIVKKKLKKLGVDIYTSSKATSLTKGDRLTLEVETKKEKITIEADKILLSIGKRANTGALGLEKTGVAVDKRGFIIVDEQLKTNVDGIFAIGDCTGPPFLAHLATKQGIIAAEVACGKNSVADFKSIPGAIFTDPEIATTGFSAAEAKEAGFEVQEARASFGASGKALSMNQSEGYVNLISDAKTGILLGAEVVGVHASDLISEISLALELGASTEDLGFTIHPHPTLPEMIMEAAESAMGSAIHVPNSKKPIKH